MKLSNGSFNCKAYIFNRRVHHGEIGSLLGFSNLFKKSQPLPSGILSGLGEGLAKDDYGDVKEWFTFKKKDTAAEPSNTTQSTHTTVGATTARRKLGIIFGPQENRRDPTRVCIYWISYPTFHQKAYR